MSAERWQVRHTNLDGLPITAIAYDSDTGDTPVILINDAQPRRSILKAIRQVRSDLVAVMLLPQWGEIYDWLRRAVTDCPVVMTTAAALLGAGSAATLAQPPYIPPPAVATSAPERELPPLERVAKPRGATVPGPPQQAPSTSGPETPETAPLGGGENVADATPTPTDTRDPTPEPSPTPTPQASTSPQPLAPPATPLPRVPLWR